MKTILKKSVLGIIVFALSVISIMDVFDYNNKSNINPWRYSIVSDEKCDENFSDINAEYDYVEQAFTNIAVDTDTEDTDENLYEFEDCTDEYYDDEFDIFDDSEYEDYEDYDLYEFYGLDEDSDLDEYLFDENYDLYDLEEDCVDCDYAYDNEYDYDNEFDCDDDFYYEDDFDYKDDFDYEDDFDYKDDFDCDDEFDYEDDFDCDDEFDYEDNFDHDVFVVKFIKDYKNNPKGLNIDIIGFGGTGSEVSIEKENGTVLFYDKDNNYLGKYSEEGDPVVYIHSENGYYAFSIYVNPSLENMSNADLFGAEVEIYKNGELFANLSVDEDTQFNNRYATGLWAWEFAIDNGSITCVR